jgi:alpha-1,2-mannosyltransferase
MASIPRWFPVLASGTVAILGAIVAFTAAGGLTGSLVGAAVAAALVSIVLGAWAGATIHAERAQVPPGIRRLFAIGAPVLVAQLLLAATFIINPNLTRWTASPLTPQRSEHSCVSAYWVACGAIRTAPDIYAEEIYSVPQANAAAVRVARPIGPLWVDQYEYPPAFLALPRLIAAATGDFWGFRRFWFALNLAVVVAGLLMVAVRFDRALGTHARWLTPFVLVAPAIIITLVIGNVQLAIIAASMIAMILFERGRHAAGGLVLAYAIVSKLYPGLLILYLLLRREWRPVVWTAAFAVVFVAVTLADFGIGPYSAFVTHLPKLLSGEAFPAFRNPAAVAINESIPGLVFKLKLFGVAGMDFAAARVVGWIYTVVAVVLVARLALRPPAPGREPLAWITILIVATMRSPFLPTYGPFPSLWLATLLAAIAWGRSPAFMTAVVAWSVLAFTFGTGTVAPAITAIWTLAHTVAAFVLVAVAMRVAPAAMPQSSPAHAGG